MGFIKAMPHTPLVCDRNNIAECTRARGELDTKLTLVKRRSKARSNNQARRASRGKAKASPPRKSGKSSPPRKPASSPLKRKSGKSGPKSATSSSKSAASSSKGRRKSAKPASKSASPKKSMSKLGMVVSGLAGAAAGAAIISMIMKGRQTDLEQEKTALAASLKEAQAEVRVAKQRLAQAPGDEESQQEYAKAMDALSYLQKEHARCEQKIQALEYQNLEQENEVERLKMQNQQQLTEMEEAKQHYVGAIQKLQKQLETNQDEMDALLAKHGPISTAENRIEELNAELNALEKKKIENERLLQEREAVLSNAWEALNKKNKAKKEETEAIKKETEAAKNLFLQQTSNADKMIAELVKKQQELNTAVLSTKSRLDGANAELKSKNEEINSLKIQEEFIKQNMNFMENTIKSLEENIAKLGAIQEEQHGNRWAMKTNDKVPTIAFNEDWFGLPDEYVGDEDDHLDFEVGDKDMHKIQANPAYNNPNYIPSPSDTYEDTHGRAFESIV